MKYRPDVLAAHAEFGGDLQSMQALYDRPDHISRIAALEAQLAERAPGPDAETYYSKGKDADWFEKLDNKAFAWELMCAAQDLNDTGIDEPVTAWMPVLAMLSGAADRLSALEATPPAPKEPESIRRARKSIFQDQGYAATPPAPKVTECATEGCEQPAGIHFIRGNVGSHYCIECYKRVQRISVAALSGDAS